MSHLEDKKWTFSRQLPSPCCFLIPQPTALSHTHLDHCQTPACLGCGAYEQGEQGFPCLCATFPQWGQGPRGWKTPDLISLSNQWGPWWENWWHTVTGNMTRVDLGMIMGQDKSLVREASKVWHSPQLVPQVGLELGERAVAPAWTGLPNRVCTFQ